MCLGQVAARHKGAELPQPTKLGTNITLVNEASEVHDRSGNESQHPHLHRPRLHNESSVVLLPLIPNVTHIPGSPMAGRRLGSQTGL